MHRRWVLSGLLPVACCLILGCGAESDRQVQGADTGDAESNVTCRIPASDIVGGGCDGAGIAYAQDDDWLDATCRDFRAGEQVALTRAAKYVAGHELSGVAPSVSERRLRATFVDSVREACRGSRGSYGPVQDALQRTVVKISSSP
jgi:hypothetical protein